MLQAPRFEPQDRFQTFSAARGHIGIWKLSRNHSVCFEAADLELTI